MEAFANLFRVIFSPTAAFERIKEKPAWWVPTIVFILAAMLYAYISAPQAMDLAEQEMMRQSSQMSPEQIEQAQQMLRSPLALVISMVSTLIMAIVSILIQVGLVHLVASMLGGSARFAVGLTAIAYANMPIVVQQIVFSINTAFSKTLIMPGFTAMLPRDQATSILGTFLGRIDVFAIWSLVLVAFALSIIYRLSKGKAAAVVVGYWVAGTIIAIAASAIGRAVGGA